MKVSVVIPVYNREKFIKKCLDSVLDQTFNDYEIIIIDDGSDDKTIDIIELYASNKVKIFCNSLNRGVSYTKNYGIKQSVGDYILFIDSDCIADRNWINNIIKPFSDDENIMIVGGKVLDGEQRGYWGKVNANKDFISKENKYSDIMIGCNMAFRRSFIEKYLFDEIILFGGEELDIGIRARKNGYSLYYVDSAEVVHHHRQGYREILKQSYMYGFGNIYVYIKNKHFPFINYASWLLIFLIISIFMGNNLISLSLLFLYLFVIFFVNKFDRNRSIIDSFITFPGFLLICLANFVGNISFLFNLIKNKGIDKW